MSERLGVREKMIDKIDWKNPIEVKKYHQEKHKRYISNPEYGKKRREYGKKWYASKGRPYYTKYYYSHKEAIKKNYKKYEEKKGIEWNRKRKMDWAKSNPEKIKKSHKRFLKRNPRYYQSPERIWESIKINAKKRNKPFSLYPKEKFISWYNNQKKVCCYCNLDEDLILDYAWFFSNKKVKRLSLERLDNKKGYIWGNIALACDDCNSMKSSFLSAKEMEKYGRLNRKKKIDELFPYYKDRLKKISKMKLL